MPLSFQRPPLSVFAAGRRQSNVVADDKVVQDEHINEEAQQEPKTFHDFLRFYPLQPEDKTIDPKQNRGAKPVNPLQQSRPNPLQAANPRANPLQNMHRQQHLRQNQPLPNMPQNHARNEVQSVPTAAWPSGSTHGQDTQLERTDPQNAAEHFRRVNKNLPDGVMYEPLDEETMRLLKAAKPSTVPAQNTPPTPQLPQATNITPPPPNEPNNAHTIPSQISDIIQTLAQNEHNAHIFYSAISHSSPTIEIQTSLESIAAECEQRVVLYTQVLSQHFSHEFSPAHKDINTSLPFHKAITLAVFEENKTLSTLSNLQSQITETSLERQIERIISKKIIAHQLLLTCFATSQF